MEMHVLPFVVPLVPHAALLGLLSVRNPLPATSHRIRLFRVHGRTEQFTLKHPGAPNTRALAANHLDSWVIIPLAHPEGGQRKKAEFYSLNKFV